MATRRELAPFESLQAAADDARRLLEGGYDRAGNWSLGQCCGHLANWLNYQIDGYPPLPLFLKPIFFIVRNTNASRLLRKVNQSGRMPVGSATAPSSIPSATITDADGFTQYDRTVTRWLNHSGEFLPPPLFGQQSRPTWLRLHCVHAAHHLSFLVPKQR
jgi:hypothetical protein